MAHIHNITPVNKKVIQHFKEQNKSITQPGKIEKRNTSDWTKHCKPDKRKKRRGPQTWHANTREGRKNTVQLVWDESQRWHKATVSHRDVRETQRLEIREDIRIQLLEFNKLWGGTAIWAFLEKNSNSIIVSFSRICPENEYVREPTCMGCWARKLGQVYKLTCKLFNHDINTIPNSIYLFMNCSNSKVKIRQSYAFESIKANIFDA